MLDQLLAQVTGNDAESLLGESGLIGQLKEQLAERMLAAELTHHLASEAAEDGSGNHRNGASPKTVITPNGALDLNIPRDRLATFEPQLVAKYQRRLPGFDDQVISMYARGMTVREIQGHLAELYGLEVSPELISKKWLRLSEHHSPIYKWSSGGSNVRRCFHECRATRGAPEASFYAASASVGSQPR